MLFKKLVKQHRVHRVVAHGIGLAFFVAHEHLGKQIAALTAGLQEVSDQLEANKLIPQVVANDQ